MSLAEFQYRYTVNFSQIDEFSAYCSVISKGFCPFLSPAEKHGVLFATNYDLHGHSIAELQEFIFYTGVIHVEKLRQYRQNHHGTARGILACENVIFNLSDPYRDVDGHNLFSYPHWVLKALYTKVGIMIGKFWVGEEATSQSGLEIPQPPCLFLSIRSAIKERDPYFFSKAPHLLPSLTSSIDSLQNVHDFLLPNGCDIYSIESMYDSRYYLIALEWALHQMENKKNASG